VGYRGWIIKIAVICSLCVLLLFPGCAGKAASTVKAVSETEPGLIADFNASKSEGFKPLEVKFQSTSRGTVDKYFWDYGDGTLGNEQNPAHIYNQTGKYSVTLTVIGRGCSNSITKTGFITVLQPEKTGSEIINWKDAGNYVGNRGTVEGTIVATRYLTSTNGKPTFLNFNNPYKGFFTCLIWGSDRDKFIRSYAADPEKFLLNKMVQVTGLIEEYPAGSKIPEMIVKDPAQIVVTGNN
jgi:hypothetical protein